MSDEDETGAQLAGKARMMEEDEDESRKSKRWRIRDERRGGKTTDEEGTGDEERGTPDEDERRR